MTKLVRAAVALMVAIASLTTVAGCADQNPRIPNPRQGEGWAAMSLPNRHAGQPTVFDVIYLCLDRPGKVEIADVKVEYAEGGFYVQAFATRPTVPPDGVPYPQPTEPADETLWDLGYAKGHVTIDTTCAQTIESTPQESLTQVGVQFSKPTDKTARGALIHITYKSGDKTYSYRMGFEAILCETKESNPECATWDYDWSQEPVKVVRSHGW